MEDNKVKVTTAYNVEIEYHTASAWDRTLAYVIDLLIKYGYAALVSAVLFTGMNMFNIWLSILFALPFVFYSLIFELFNNGKTPGKSFLKLQVVSLTGKNTTTGQFIIRWFTRLLDFTPSLGFIAVSVSLKGQRIGDSLANTCVITQKEPNAYIGKLSKVRIPKGYVGKYREALLLKEHEIQILKDSIFNYTPASHKVQLAAAARIMDVTGIPKRIPAKKYLKMIVYDYNYFQQLDERGEEE